MSHPLQPSLIEKYGREIKETKGMVGWGSGDEEYLKIM